MAIPPSNAWETTTKSSLVSIGTHSLFLSTSGPSRKPYSPVIIHFTGHGISTAFYVRLQALLSTSARVYFYDRAGYGDSEIGPTTHPTAENAAAELHALLSAVNVAPPYVLVSHTYGAIIAREFLALENSLASAATLRAAAPIAGMVLVNGVTEMQLFAVQPLTRPQYKNVMAGLNPNELIHFREESGLSDEQWKDAHRMAERTFCTMCDEDICRSGALLAKKMQFRLLAMGQQSLSIIRSDSTRKNMVIYDAAVKAGNGSEDDRAAFKQWIDTMKFYGDTMGAGQMLLSGNFKDQFEPDYGGNIPITNPGIVVGEVKWVFKQLK